MISTEKIVLCSASPRRKQLLTELGFNFEIIIREVDESFPKQLRAENVALFLAEKKAQAFQDWFKPGKIYLTADTIVWLNNETLVKPVDAADATIMLKKLSGNKHQVFTAVCLADVENQKMFCVKSEVQFKRLKDEEIDFYVRKYQPFDKAGAYGAQECLPEGMNPCSKEEVEFLKSIGRPDLFVRTLSPGKEQMPIIEKIEGSYFNVMGLPVVELYEALKKWQ